MKGGRSGALKPGKLGFSYDAETGDLGVLPTHEPSLMVMLAQPAPSECLHKYK